MNGFLRAQSMYERMEPPICECPDDCQGCYAIDAGMSECCGRCSEEPEYDWDERDDEWKAEVRASRYE